MTRFSWAAVAFLVAVALTLIFSPSARLERPHA